MMLPSAAASATTTLPAMASLEPQGLGMVDELDDPSPGHMSEHPTALSTTTTTATASKPMFGGTLEQRFVSSSNEMEVDEKKA